MWPGGLIAARTASASKSPRRSDGAELDAGVRGAGAGLVEDDVRFDRDQHVVPRPGQGAQRDLVGHGAARQEEGCLGAEQLRDLLLEAVDRRVLAVLVVADLGVRHGAAHGRRRQRDRVGAQVDPIGHVPDDRGADQWAGRRPGSGRRARRRWTSAPNGADGAGSDPGTPRSHSTAASRSSTQNGLASTATPGPEMRSSASRPAGCRCR